ncbi:MAG: efflux RND transporter periplasmic adaptor subunit [Gammaproteobacteria bacterium]|nr:efflux RND transporter periplasmic adaptor subunit [Gammaproteobacteria bacterium]
MISMGMTRVAVLLAGLLLAASPVRAADEATPVAVVPLSSLAIYPQLSAPAQVVSLNDSLVDASITATVEQIAVRVGDVAAAGSELLRLECGDQRDILGQRLAARDALKARLAFAEFQYARARSLVQGKTISDEQLRQRQADAGALQAELDGAESGVTLAQRNVERCVVRAPFQAVVMERLMGVGERAQPGKPLLRLLDLSLLEVTAQVPAFDAAPLASMQGVDETELTLQVDGRRYPLALRRVVAALEPRSRSRELRLDFVGEPAPPGSSGRLQWRHPHPHLPAEFLLRRDDRYGVYLLREGRAQFVVVDDAREGSPVALSLPPETLIITEGRYGLIDGAAVVVVE